MKHLTQIAGVLLLIQQAFSASVLYEKDTTAVRINDTQLNVVTLGKKAISERATVVKQFKIAQITTEVWFQYPRQLNCLLIPTVHDQIQMHSSGSFTMPFLHN